MSNATKTIQIGKKKKIKPHSLLQELDGFIPRYTSSDVPEQDFVIDNSFELRKYKQNKRFKQKNAPAVAPVAPVPLTSPTISPPKVALISSESASPTTKKTSPIKPTPKTSPIKPTPKTEPSNPKPQFLPASTPLRAYTQPSTPVQHSVIGNKDHKQNLQHIIEQYKKTKKIHKDLDTESVQSHSSLIDIMSIANLTSSQLQFITNNSTHCTTYQRPVQPVQQLTNYPHTQISKSSQSTQYRHTVQVATKQTTHKQQYSSTKDISTFNTHYKKYYNKPYSNDYICVPSLSVSTIQIKKNIKKKDILRMKQQLVTHGIINDIYSDIPETLLLDLYAMLSDKKCSFTITQL